MSPEHAVLATYYRNNVLHLFAMPSLIACCFLANAAMRTEDVQRLAGRIYPYVASELFLRWREQELTASSNARSVSLAALGLLEGSAESADLAAAGAELAEAAMQLSLLAQTTIQTIERYYLAIALLIQAGSGEITQTAARGALPADGAAHDDAVWVQFAGVLRPHVCSRISSICCAPAAWCAPRNPAGCCSMRC